MLPRAFDCVLPRAFDCVNAVIPSSCLPELEDAGELPRAFDCVLPRAFDCVNAVIPSSCLINHVPALFTVFNVFLHSSARLGPFL